MGEVVSMAKPEVQDSFNLVSSSRTVNYKDQDTAFVQLTFTLAVSSADTAAYDASKLADIIEDAVGCILVDYAEDGQEITV